VHIGLKEKVTNSKMAKKSGKVAKKTPIKVPLKGTPPDTPEVLIRRSVLARVSKF
jgi:hypothetical protein